MAALIACEASAIASKDVDILADINWRIERGQHWAVLGPNGSGKTTLLRIACGYLWPTSGRVLRLGEELIDLGELRRSIGWISSGMIADIPPRDTGLETVVSGRFAQIGLKRFAGSRADAMPTSPMRRPSSRAWVAKSLADKPFGVLSQGERQQVLIARARMARPLLLVLDEPCAGMDPGVRERFLALAERACHPTPSRPPSCSSRITSKKSFPASRTRSSCRGGRVHSAGPTQRSRHARSD